MGNPARQPSYGFHLLRLAKLILQHPPLGNILGNNFHNFGSLFRAVNHAPTQPHRYRTAILALPPDLNIVQFRAPLKFPHDSRLLARIQKHVRVRIQRQQLFRRFISEHCDQRRIHIEKSSLQAGSINSINRALHQRPVARLRTPQCLLIAFVFNRARQLLRYELQNLFVLLIKTRTPAIALHRQNAESCIAGFQRNSQPIQRRRANQLGLSAFHQFGKNLRSAHQRLTASQHVLGKPLTQLSRRRPALPFILEIRKAERLGQRIVQRNIEIARVHKLAHNAVHRGIKLLQIVIRTVFLGDAIERRMQRLCPFLFRYIAIQHAHRDLFAVDQNRSSRNENVQQRPILALPLGFKDNLLPFHQQVRNPARLRVPVRGNDQRVDSLSQGLRRAKAKDACELAIEPGNVKRRVQNCDGFGRALY